MFDARKVDADQYPNNFCASSASLIPAGIADAGYSRPQC